MGVQARDVNSAKTPLGKHCTLDFLYKRDIIARALWRLSALNILCWPELAHLHNAFSLFSRNFNCIEINFSNKIRNI